MDKSNATKLLDPRNLSDSFGDHREVSFWQVPQLVMLTSLFLLIVVGNGCVLLSLIYSENGIKTRMNFFILHLAIADLLVGLVIVGHDIVEKVQIDFNGGSFLCKLLQYIKVVVIYSSTYVLVSMSIDRLDAVARPMRFSRREFRAKVLIAAAWILSFVFGLPILVLFDVTDDNVTYLDKTVTLCDPDFNHIHGPKIYMTLIALAAFIIPTLIIMVCYCFIIAVICRNDDDAQRERSNWTFERQESLLSNVTVDSSRGYSLGRHRNPIIERAKVRTVKMTVFIVLGVRFGDTPHQHNEGCHIPGQQSLPAQLSRQPDHLRNLQYQDLSKSKTCAIFETFRVLWATQAPLREQNVAYLASRRCFSE
eukprot:XP_019927986.1 PREDICTED: cardioacceleratory peptide receptor isoform X2 [Crassostrea gigas]